MKYTLKVHTQNLLLFQGLLKSLMRGFSLIYFVASLLTLRLKSSIKALHPLYEPLIKALKPQEKTLLLLILRKLLKVLKSQNPSLSNQELEKFFSQSTPATKLKEIFFTNSLVSLGCHEGQRVIDNKVILGTRLGPETYCLQGVAHEMAHLLEIDNKRMTKSGWGFKYGKKIQIMGQIFHEPLTYQASLRECRTFAFEMLIYEIIGQEYDKKELISPLKYMNDYLHVPGKTDDGRLKFLLKECLKFKKTLSQEKVLSLWHEKNQYLKKKMKKTS